MAPGFTGGFSKTRVSAVGLMEPDEVLGGQENERAARSCGHPESAFHRESV